MCLSSSTLELSLVPPTSTLRGCHLSSQQWLFSARCFCSTTILVWHQAQSYLSLLLIQSSQKYSLELIEIVRLILGGTGVHTALEWTLPTSCIWMWYCPESSRSYPARPTVLSIGSQESRSKQRWILSCPWSRFSRSRTSTKSSCFCSGYQKIREERGPRSPPVLRC